VSKRELSSHEVIILCNGSQQLSVGLVLNGRGVHMVGRGVAGERWVQEGAGECARWV